MTKTKSEKKENKYKFDLSDGFGREDIAGIFVMIWRAILAILTVILYPYVWMYRMTIRGLLFIRSDEPAEQPLNETQKRFIEALPTFFILTGFFLGILIGIALWLGAEDALLDFIDTVSLDVIFKLVYNVLAFILEVILWIIGLDTTVNGVKTERFGIVDVFRVVFIDFLVGSLVEDPVLTFLGIGLVGLILIVLAIVVSETTLFIKLFGTVKKFTVVLLTLPYQLYTKGNVVFYKFNEKLASLIYGRKRIDNRNVGFHRKLTLLIYSFALYIFFSGIVILITNRNQLTDNVARLSFFTVILLVFGLGVGIVGLWVIARFLDLLSKEKYRLESQEAKAK